MMSNPYTKRKREIAPEIDFDAICPPDNVLLEALEAAEKILLATHRLSSSTIDTASVNTVTQETDARYSQLDSTAFNRKAIQNLATTTSAKFGNATSSASHRTADLLRLIVCPIKPTFRAAEAPRVHQPVAPSLSNVLLNVPLHLSAAASGPVKNCNGSRAMKSDDSDDLSDTDDDAGGCLTQMMREECRDLHDNPEQRQLAMHLVEMRKLIEKHVDDLLQRNEQIDGKLERSLHVKINALKRAGVIPKDLADAMHKIREFGNGGAHHHASLPPKKMVEAAFQSYVGLKKNFNEK